MRLSIFLSVFLSTTAFASGVKNGFWRLEVKNDGVEIRDSYVRNCTDTLSYQGFYVAHFTSKTDFESGVNSNGDYFWNAAYLNEIYATVKYELKLKRISEDLFQGTAYTVGLHPHEVGPAKATFISEVIPVDFTSLCW